MPGFRKRTGPGRPATRGQTESYYAVMRGPRTPPRPVPPICPRCTSQLDPGIGYCTTCKTWPLLNPEAP